MLVFGLTEKACSFPNRVCDWHRKQLINEVNNAPSPWNNRNYMIRERIKYRSGRGTGLPILHTVTLRYKTVNN